MQQSFTIRLKDVRAALADRRAQRRLAGELASFRTTAERAEIDHLLSRHTPEETEHLRRILSAQDAHRRTSARRETAGLGGYLG